MGSGRRRSPDGDELSPRPVTVVVVGQTPPPYHGQAIMIDALVSGSYERVDIRHVRMAFSATLDDMGRVGIGKLGELVRVIIAVWRARYRFGGDVLYYPPAGPSRITVLRDVVLLLMTRPLFRHTAFHFHASGLSDLLPRLPPAFRWLAERAYARPDAAIVLSERTAMDGQALAATRTVVTPYGIEDAARTQSADAGSDVSGRVPTVLFVGAVRETKGVSVLMEACERLARDGVPFRCRIVGGTTDPDYATRLRRRIVEEGLEDRVELTGVLTGDAKWEAYRSADVFCFPTFYESESFGVVLVEAMMWGLPAVATVWRGVPDLVEDGRTGFLVPVKDAPALTQALTRLLTDERLRATMGRRARARYEERYTIERWRQRMEDVLAEVGADRA